MGEMWNLSDLTWVLGAYLLGSVPFGILLAKVRGVDLRAVGSGNIGATNAMRALGKPLGLLAFALDLGKGFFVPWYLLQSGSAEALAVASAAGVAAAAGHVWPIWIGFRGGKAVATALGALCAVDPAVALWGGPVWLLAVFVSSHVSVGSLAMSASFPVTAWLRWGEDEGGEWFAAAALLLCILIWARHRPNIERLLQGEEARTRLGLRSRGSAGAESDE
ncbi:MAG: acyl-phosphate glycerol 3-phosphate acyltransferase [Deltaproteobacteria bacterium]|nr:acyl-phosphate glycerol 3-phosphate acyltransferase [Deltaproteobacteria bacterium]